MNLSEIKLPDLELASGGFDLRGMEKLNSMCIEGVTIKGDRMETRLTLNYLVEKNFPIKPLLQFIGVEKYNTQQAVLSVFHSDGTPIMVLHCSALVLKKVSLNLSNSTKHSVALQMEYTVDSIS